MTQAFNLSQLANNLNTVGQLDATDGLTGAVPIANGGTGLTSTPSNGQIDIGNGSGFTRATLSAGSNISITNGAGSITIASTAGAPTTAQVLSATAGLTAGDVGTYAFVLTTVNTLPSGGYSGAFGGTRSGSQLRPVSVYVTASSQATGSPSSLSGTWRSLGWDNSQDYGGNNLATVYVRIS